MRSSKKRLKPVGIPVWSPTVGSLEFPLIPTIDISGRERRITCKQLNNTTKPEQLILSKTYLTK
jgi:hypothetical protein